MLLTPAVCWIGCTIYPMLLTDIDPVLQGSSLPCPPLQQSCLHVLCLGQKGYKQTALGRMPELMLW
jgi:hypothetical protein